MSDFRTHNIDLFGFSTGALERGEFRVACDWMAESNVGAIELSALRLAELRPLVEQVESLPMDAFTYVSFHAPIAFPESLEEDVVELLAKIAKQEWNVIVHPDVIYDPARWRILGSRLLIENMDRRKSTGRFVNELDALFQALPDAGLCLDVAHARQLDTTLTLLLELITVFAKRIREIHISELDSRCAHHRMSASAVRDYMRIKEFISEGTPVIVESMLDGVQNQERLAELNLAYKALA